MKINTEYEIGQHVWFAYKNNTEEICVCEDYIQEIVITKNGLYYYLCDTDAEIKEEEIIPYEDKNKLSVTIQKLINQIKENVE